MVSKHWSAQRAIGYLSLGIFLKSLLRSITQWLQRKETQWFLKTKQMSVKTIDPLLVSHEIDLKLEILG